MSHRLEGPWILPGTPSRYVVVPWFHPAAGESHHRVSATPATWMLDAWLSSSRIVLQQIQEALEGDPSSRLTTGGHCEREARLKQCLAEAFRSGRLVVLQERGLNPEVTEAEIPREARLAGSQIPDDGGSVRTRRALGSVKVPTPHGTSGTVCEFIRLIEKVEAAYPEWDADSVVRALRRTAGYDDMRFRIMSGGVAGLVLNPVNKLTKKDIKRLELLTSHSRGSSRETGIGRDHFGYNVALGHVVTGIAAGMRRRKKLDIVKEYINEHVGVPTVFAAGEYIDNLYAMTIAGDLGQ